MADHTIYLIGGAEDETAELALESRDELCHVTLRYRDRSIEASATDYFDAFCQIRLQLEAERLIPFCYGASLNVYPSPMARDMGEGLSAYRLTIGRQASQVDLVRIFDAGHDVIPAYVAMQKQHYDEWLQSLET